GLIRMLPNRLILPPAWAFIPPGDRLRVAIGTGRRPDGSEGPVGPHLRNLRQVFHAVGGMGARKSQLGANIAQQLIPHGFMLADGKGGDNDSLTTRVRHLIPLADEQRLVLVNFLDAQWPMGINPLWLGTGTVSEATYDQVVGQTLSMFGKLDPKTWPSAAGMRDQLTMALLLVLEGEAAPTLPQVRQVFVDPDYRERLLPLCTNVEVQEYWRVTYAAMGEGHKASRDALFRRFNLLLLPSLIRHLVCQRIPSLDVGKVIDQKLILLCPLADNKLGDLARALGMLLISSIVKAAFEREGTAQTRHDMALMIDELGVFLNEHDNSDMRTALSRLRSLGIPQLYFNQALSQLHDVEDLLLINTGNRTILQTLEPDATRLAKIYDLDAADIKNQPPEAHQYVDFRVQVGDYGERRTYPCSVRPLPWPTPTIETPDAYTGADWRAQWAPAMTREERQLDVLHREVVGRLRVDPMALLAATRHWSADQWVAYQARTAEHRQHQRAYILRNPGCIDDRLKRQDWLSRLAWNRPVFEAVVDYVRARREVPLKGEAAGTTTHGGMTPPPRQQVGAGSGGTAPPPAESAKNDTTTRDVWQALKEAGEADLDALDREIDPDYDLFLE
ncbi:MAG TPA: hypothetical protein VGE07_11740, partial [Herpetosiphonaceae bacterium]